MYFTADPINIATGNVYYSATDYETAGQNKLQYTRFYNSRGLGLFEQGINWRNNFDGTLVPNGGTQAIVTRPDGQQVNFNISGGIWKPDTDVDLKLTKSGSVWTLTDHDDNVETYSGATPVLASIVKRNG